MRTARIVCATLGAALLLTVFASNFRAAPAPASSLSKELPAEEAASPAIDPAELAGNAALRVKDVANFTTSRNNLRQIAIEVHNYAATFDSVLVGDIVSKEGKRLLSWRVALLNFLEEDNLYKQFKLDEPWDSKHNLALLEKMPKVFRSPRVTVKRNGYTVYQVFSGPGALFEAGKSKYRIGNIPDGTSNTLLAVESSQAVPWTKPADLTYDKDKDIPDFGKAFGGRPLGALADGSVRVLDLKKLSSTTLRNAICPDDGNVLGADW